jgi:cytoskeletal protein CcmA (bactofilin family)
MIGALHLRTALIFAAAVVATLASTAVPVSAADDDHSKVLGSVHIEPGQHTGDATTVNGSVEIGANAIVNNADTVNGNITLREHSTAASVNTVNGSARLEKGARVSGNLALVNGPISLDREADVSGRLTNVNGAIQLDAAHVGGGIETTAGDIDIGPSSRVEGGILVKEDNTWFSFFSPKIPRVVIGPGAVVKGTLKFQREVKLYVSDRATIGPVEGATVNKFTGEHP